MDDLQDIVKEFLVECHENLDQLDRDLVQLEQDPTREDELSSIFRTIHTIKGTCGFLGFDKLQGVAHVGENLLSKLRDRELTLRPDITTGLLSLVDVIREILANIETLGAEGEADYSELLQTLVQLQSGAPLAVAAAPPVPHLNPHIVPPPAEIKQLEANQPLEARDSESTGAEIRQTGATDSTVRVNVDLLDKLMNRVGELVLARNQIVQFIAANDTAALVGASQRLNLITSELQAAVMKTRMQPIGNVWSKFPRVVRDLALQCGKQVRIEMEGHETELDKAMVESIKDPLTHLLRNAIDHGVELPDVRLAAGKPAEGRLQLCAGHEGGQVTIELCDDGSGLNVQRIRQKSIERGIVTAAQAETMSDHDAALLIFSAGFSTATAVTHISGRGVGMDVVKTNVERIGGTVDIESRLGYGTSIKLKIPLTLAIIPALIVTCGEERYAVPQSSLLELVRLDGLKATHGIEQIHGARVYRLRGQLLPIVDLRHELGLESPERNALVGIQECTHIVVLKADDRQFGLVVDSISDTEEIVVKPLSSQLKNISAFAGATIRGDGRIALILDVLGLARKAGVVSEVRTPTLREPPVRATDDEQQRQSMLVVEVGDRRLAMPVSFVSRLEEIAPQAIEHASGSEVVQYRGRILPLIRLGQILGVAASDDDERLMQVVVCGERSNNIGLVVDRIADIVPTDVGRRPSNGKLLSPTVIGERVTDLLNVPALIRQVDPSFFDHGVATEETCA